MDITKNKKPFERRESCPAKGRETGQSGIFGGSRRLLGFGGALGACFGLQADQRIPEVICDVFLLAQLYSVNSWLRCVNRCGNLHFR